MMISTESFLSPKNPLDDPENKELPYVSTSDIAIRLYDDLTLKLQSEVLPVEVQLMLEPMWIVRSRYHSSMKPLDDAMEEYMKFRIRLKEIDAHIELGVASTLDIGTAFNQIFGLLNIYEKNQKELHSIMREVHHQILAFVNASKNDVMWNEMVRLRDIDYLQFSRKTCSFEHAVTCLYTLDTSLRESLKTSAEIYKCCCNYLLRISEHINSNGVSGPEGARMESGKDFGRDDVDSFTKKNIPENQNGTN